MYFSVMRPLTLFIGILFCSQLFAQRPPETQGIGAVEISSASPSETDFSDLGILDSILAQKRVVLLGRQHDGNAVDYQFMIRLLKYLHEQQRFNMLILDSDFYEMFNASIAVSNDASAINDYGSAIGGSFGESSIRNELLNYLQAQAKAGTPIFLFGMDCVHSNQYLADQLQEGLEQGLPKVAKSKEQKRFMEILKQLLKESYKSKATDIDKKIYFAHIDKLQQEATVADTMSMLYLFRPLMESLEGFAKDAWNVDELSGPARQNYRNAQMATNVDWLVNKIVKNQKVLVFSSNERLSYGQAPTKDSKQVTLGYLLKQSFGDVCFNIASTAYSGKVAASPKELKLPKPAKNSLEKQLADVGYQHAFLCFDTDDVAPALLESFPMFYYNFNMDMEGDEGTKVYSKLFDAVIFHQTAAPLGK